MSVKITEAGGARIGRWTWDREQTQQALRDAKACRESRKVTRTNNDCTCTCCRIDRAFRAKNGEG